MKNLYWILLGMGAAGVLAYLYFKNRQRADQGGESPERVYTVPAGDNAEVSGTGVKSGVSSFGSVRLS